MIVFYCIDDVCTEYTNKGMTYFSVHRKIFLKNYGTYVWECHTDLAGSGRYPTVWQGVEKSGLNAILDLTLL